ncbi:MAG: hypothetical protein JWR10_3646 [Rubritepida sp.]|nr:hypothetical protein [Rubritepida sp.]
MSRGKWVTLKLHQLRLDQENYRLGPQPTQRDAIRTMINDQGTKLVRLANDILRMEGVSPGEPIWVVPAKARGQYIVEEGNRRVTALKLLETPALADGTGVSKQFRRLAKSYAENPIRDLDARLFATRADALPWKRRRHMTAGSGVGLAPWKTLAKGRANRDLGEDAPGSLAVVEFFADDKSESWAEILEALDGRWSTVDRVLNAQSFKATLGVAIDLNTGAVTFENGDVKGGSDLLKRILGAMASPDFEFADVENRDDRKRFISRFGDYSLKLKAGESAPTGPPATPPGSSPGAGELNSMVEPTPNLGTSGGAAPLSGTPSPFASTKPETLVSTTPSRRAVADANRTTLAPASGPRILPVEGIRLLPLYNECRKIKVKGNENAAAFLVRVFIELSSENYLQEKNVQIPRSLRDKSITTWEDYKVKLSDKINAVTLHIDPSKRAPIFAQAREAIQKDAVGSFSINTLHSYFHNRHVLPQEDTIRASWDGWEAYLQAVFDALKTP